MKSDRIHSKKDLLPFRKELRSNLTPAEAFLWNQVKAKQLDGKRFVKQQSIGEHIVDFYCVSEKLIVELDGEVHQNPKAQAYDARRTSVFQNMGYTVIRFDNKMVFEHLNSVLSEIKDNFKT